MKELKFRAYIHRYKMVRPVESIDFKSQVITCHLTNDLEEGDPAEFDFDEIDLMQYTGNKNKKGEDIYEKVRVLYKSSPKLDSFTTLPCSFGKKLDSTPDEPEITPLATHEISEKICGYGLEKLLEPNPALVRYLADFRDNVIKVIEYERSKRKELEQKLLEEVA